MSYQLHNVDNALLSAISLTMGGTSIKFQFPPEIKSDSKGMNFQEKDMGNIEPMAIFKGSKAREIQIDWTYIISGGTWNTKAVSTQVKAIRKFFYATIQDVYAGPAFTGVDLGAGVKVGVQTPGTQGAPIIIKLKAYDVVGASANSNTMSFRADGVNITHKGPIISEVSGSEIKSAYPLRTDISMKLKLWTKGKASTNGDDEKGMIDLFSVAGPKELGATGGIWY